MKALLLTLLLIPTLLVAQNRGRRGGPPGPPKDDTTIDPTTLPQLTPEQIATIQKQLDEIEGKFGKNRGDILGLALARCKVASASEKDALELYIACYKTEHFDKLNLKPTDFTEWKQHQEDHFKDPEFLESIWMQVRFLTFAIQGQDVKEKDLPALVQAVQAFIGDELRVVSSSVVHTTTGAVKENDKIKKPATRPGGGGGRNFDSSALLRSLNEPVQQSEFAKAFQLEEFLTRQDWAYTPLDIGSIYSGIIFPYYLDKKPTELPAQWDMRIKEQLAMKQATYTDVEYQTYFKDHYPELLWEKSKWLLSKNLDQKISTAALAEMLKVIRDNPSHPKTGDWIKEMRAMINQSSQPALTLDPSLGAPPPGQPSPTAPATAPAGS